VQSWRANALHSSAEPKWRLSRERLAGREISSANAALIETCSINC